MPPGTSLQETDRVLRHIEQFIKETPEIESYSRRTGARLALAIAEPNTGDFLIKLKRERKRAIGRSHVRTAPQDRLFRTRHRSGVPAHSGGLDRRSRMVAAADRDQGASRRRGCLQGGRASRSKNGCRRSRESWTSSTGRSLSAPRINFRVDPEKARLAGFGVKDVADLQAAMLDGELASDLIRGERLVGIRVRYPVEYRSSTEKLKSLLLTSPTGRPFRCRASQAWKWRKARRRYAART